jgi:K(+)-stimulated pyrophosphate-energized sodium pump
VIYWFTGALAQAVTTGAHRAVEFIKANIETTASRRRQSPTARRWSRSARRCSADVQHLPPCSSRRSRSRSTSRSSSSAIFISIALFGLYQAIFAANAGGAWDNAKKIVEVERKAKGRRSTATVVGDTVGDPFGDTSSVAMNPVIKFTTLFASWRSIGRMADHRCGSHDEPRACGGVFCPVDGISVAIVLRHADRHVAGVDLK